MGAFRGHHTQASALALTATRHLLTQQVRAGTMSLLWGHQEVARGADSPLTAEAPPVVDPLDA